MTYAEAQELASDAFRYFFHGNRDDDNLFAYGNLYRMRWFTKLTAGRVHYEVGLFLFDREFEHRLSVYRELVAYLRTPGKWEEV